MTNFSVAYKEPDQTHFIKNKKPVHLPLDKYFIYEYRGFGLYSINLKNTPADELEVILDQCEAVENACWDAQENFHEYAKKRNLLTYAVKDGKIVAFQIASYWIYNNYFIYDLDETMVIKECRGNSMALALSAVSCRTLYLKMSNMKEVNTMTFISLTPNIRLINILDRLRFAIRFVDTSFNPSLNLMKIHDTVLERKEAVLVHEDFPFFLRGIFPGSLKQGDCSYRTSGRIRKILPPGLDLKSRGDAFLFIACFSKTGIIPIMVVLLIKALGFKVIFSKKLGLISFHKIKDF